MNNATPRELFGTDEPQPEQRLLRAGRLTAVLEDGNLRYIRFAGVEVVRAINYLARDASWGTYKPALANLCVSEQRDRFHVTYDGRSGDENNQLAYRVEIEGTAAGLLTVHAEATALTDFTTNRTGFVVLHPAAAAGGALTITHTDGRMERTTFPRLISADQPAFDIAELEHEPAAGVVCRVEMSGDAFEMEDQRNWSDASFKTYVRPLSKPRPYRLPKGTSDAQRIVVTVEGHVPAEPLAEHEAAALRFGEPVGRMPHAALFCDDTVPFVELPAGLVRKVIARLDPAASDERFATAVRRVIEAGAELSVELVLDATNPDAEATAALARLAKAGAEPSGLLVSPRRDFKTRPSNSLPPGETPAAALVEALRRAGFGGSIGAGTPSNFTEFNRNPPAPECDFVYFSVCATVHAADDLSVVETLEAYPAILDSARSLCPGKPIWLGSATVAPRHNPYGAAPPANPQGTRVPAAQTDPRHGSLFGAAFAIGIASTTTSDVDLMALAAPTGPFGLLAEDMSPRPILAVQKELAQAGGGLRLDCETGHPHIRAVAWSAEGERRMLFVNLGSETLSVTAPPSFQIYALDEGGWVEVPFSGAVLTRSLRPYLVRQPLQALQG